MIAILRADLARPPPLYLQVAELDALRSEGELFGQLLREAGNHLTFDLAHRLPHAYLRMVGQVPAAHQRWFVAPDGFASSLPA